MFTDDVKIKTPSGDKVIRHITAGSEVISRDAGGNEFTDTVEATLEPRYDEVYVVTTQGANNAKGYISATLTQPLLLADSTYKEVASLRIGDKLMGAGKVVGVVYSGERKVYDLKLTGGGDYFVNGLVAKTATDEW